MMRSFAFHFRPHPHAGVAFQTIETLRTVERYRCTLMTVNTRIGYSQFGFSPGGPVAPGYSNPASSTLSFAD
jgi:hypothetical protein